MNSSSREQPGTDSRRNRPAERGNDQGLAVELWPLERALPYARNPRTVPESAIAKVAASIKEFGFRQPVVVDAEGVVIAGHTRLLAAQRLGLAQVPVHVAADLSPQQAKAYRLADNRSAQETAWDEELLPLELGELLADDFALEATGFDPDELAALLSSPNPGLTDPDDAPPPPQEPTSRRGDLWLLGDHRLLCGDATDAEDVRRLMDGQRAVLMATDPPYLVDYQGGSHPASASNKGAPAKDKHWDAYVDHEQAVGFYASFLRLALDEALTEDAAVYQWFAVMRSEVVWPAWRAVGLLPHQVLIWRKSRSVLTHSHYLWDFEPMMYGWPEGHQPRRKPPADATAVWEIASTIEDGAGGLHPTQKPVETIRRPIRFHTSPGGLLYEPFAGSGTALIAAEEQGRRCHAMELSPAFVDAAVARWEAFSGKEARRG